MTVTTTDAGILACLGASPRASRLVRERDSVPSSVCHDCSTATTTLQLHTRARLYEDLSAFNSADHVGGELDDAQRPSEGPGRSRSATTKGLVQMAAFRR